MTFKRCFWLLLLSLIITIVTGIFSNNSIFYYMTIFVAWLLIIWFATALFKGAEEPKPSGVEGIKSKPA